MMMSMAGGSFSIWEPDHHGAVPMDQVARLTCTEKLTGRSISTWTKAWLGPIEPEITW